jgi:hypothetical protein
MPAVPAMLAALAFGGVAIAALVAVLLGASWLVLRRTRLPAAVLAGGDLSRFFDQIAPAMLALGGLDLIRELLQIWLA